jgi:hypothetical protein
MTILIARILWQRGALIVYNATSLMFFTSLSRTELTFHMYVNISIQIQKKTNKKMKKKEK